MKILIRGYYGFGNFGDDILMITTFKMMRECRPHAIFNVFSNFNQNLRGFSRKVGYNQYIYRLLPEQPVLADWTFRGDYDLLIDGGGGVYFGTKGGSLFHRFSNRLLSAVGMKSITLMDRFLRRIIFRPRRLRFNKRVGIGLGIGPYPEGCPQLYSHLAEIGLYDALSVRDARSLSFLGKFKFPGSCQRGTDFTFLNQYWMPRGISFPERKRFSGRIGVVLMDWPEHNLELFAEFRKFAQESTERGYEVTFFSLDENQDKSYINFFSGQERLIIWQPNQMDLTRFLSALAGVDIIITGRAHGAIIAGQLGVVPVCLGKTQKLREVHNMFAESSLLIREPFSCDALHHAVAQIRGRYGHFLERLAADNCKNRKIAEHDILALKQWL